MKTAHQILVDARALITDPSAWTQGHGALAKGRDLTGSRIKVAPTSKKAVAWCAAGAVHCAAGITDEMTGSEADAMSEQRYNAFMALRHQMNEHHGGAIPDFNDTHTHAEVLALFDRAIEASS